MIKTLNKVGLEGTSLNIIKALYEKPTTNVILSGEKNENFSLKVKNKTKIFTLSTFIQHGTGNPSHSNHTTKRNKSHPNW